MGNQLRSFPTPFLAAYLKKRGTQIWAPLFRIDIQRNQSTIIELVSQLVQRHELLHRDAFLCDSFFRDAFSHTLFS